MDEGRAPPTKNYMEIIFLTTLSMLQTNLHAITTILSCLKTNSFTILESSANYFSDEVIAIEHRRMAESFFQFTSVS